MADVSESAIYVDLCGRTEWSSVKTCFTFLGERRNAKLGRDCTMSTEFCMETPKYFKINAPCRYLIANKLTLSSTAYRVKSGQIMYKKFRFVPQVLYSVLIPTQETSLRTSFSRCLTTVSL